MKIVSSTVVLPELCVTPTSSALTGISQLRHTPSYEQTSDLVVQALQCDTQPANAIIVATTSPDVPSPATAHRALAKLQWPTGTLGFDVTSSCTSFLSAALAAQGLLSDAQIKTICVVAAESKHPQIRKDDDRLNNLFGDGVCALHFENGGYSKIELCYTKVRHDLVDNIGVSSATDGVKPHLYIHEPKRMYREILREMVDAILAAWDYRLHRLKLLNIDNQKTSGLIFVHQANARLLEEVRERLPFDIGRRIPVLMSDIGNTVSASLPILRTRSLMLLARETQVPIDSTRQGNDLCYVSHWHNERLVVLDKGAGARGCGWLDNVTKADAIFFKELQDISLNSTSCDVWVSAGGGFQTLGCLVYQK